MGRPWPLDTVFLGAGGEHPRVDTFSADSGETGNLLNLPPTNSAYAIDIEDEEGTLAVGTKGGLVYTLMNPGSQKTERLLPTRKLPQGAPILSMCWVRKSLLAVSDTARRCFIWHTDQDAPSLALETKKSTICSLLNLPGGLLAGLSSGGMLLFWDPLEGRLVRAIDVPVPPPKGALVRMVYWSAEHALAWPSRIGHLPLFLLEKDDLRDLNAHDGVFYALSPWGEGLLTVGMEDGRLKIWEASSGTPALDFQVDRGVISSAVCSNQQGKVLLVDERGKAKAYSIGEDRLKLTDRLPGEDYRVAVVRSPERTQALYARQREEEVSGIVKEIEGGMGRFPHELIEKLHSRLAELGYEHVSLALRAEQAVQKEDIVEGLRYYSLLMEILPPENPKVCASMESYVALLERAWHIPEAAATCRRILSIDPNYRFSVKTDRLEEISKLAGDNGSIIEPDIPIERIIESGTVIRRCFTGRYVLKTLGSQSCNRVRLTPKMISEKYEKVRAESRVAGLPPAAAEQVWWLSRAGYGQVQLVTFGDGKTNDIKGLQFGVQVCCGELDTAITPVVLFDWRYVPPQESVEEGNDKASGALRRIRDKALSNPYLAAVHEALTQALRRLVTETRPERRMDR